MFGSSRHNNWGQTTVFLLLRENRVREHLETLTSIIKYFLAQRTLSNFTVKSLRASPRSSSSIIRDFLILLHKLWSHSALLRYCSGRTDFANIREYCFLVPIIWLLLKKSILIISCQFALHQVHELLITETG